MTYPMLHLFFYLDDAEIIGGIMTLPYLYWNTCIEKYPTNHISLETLNYLVQKMGLVMQVGAKVERLLKKSFP